MKKIIKFCVVVLFFIICLNTNSVFGKTKGLSEKEVKGLEQGNTVKVVKESKIYTYGPRLENPEIIDIHVMEGYEKRSISEGTILSAMKVEAYSKKCYKRQGNNYYISVNWNHVVCFIHAGNLEKVETTDEDKQKVEDFLNKANVKKVKEKKTDGINDQDLISIAQEARNLFLATGNEELRQIEHNAWAALNERGYTEKTHAEGSTEIINSNGEVAGTLSGGDMQNATFGTDTIYNRPEKTGETEAGESLDDVIDDANTFINKGDITYTEDKLSTVSNTIYNILLIVGVIIAVLMGAILGIKLMVSGIEEKAEVKKLLVPYVVGCIIIFGGFGIWKLVVTILQGV